MDGDRALLYRIALIRRELQCVRVCTCVRACVLHLDFCDNARIGMGFASHQLHSLWVNVAYVG